MIKNEIKILSDIEHVTARKQMYIGATSIEEREQFMFGQFTKVKYVPGLIKIIEELINNCTDEAIRTNFEFANKINVQIDQTTSIIIVEDNGRGIPQTLIQTPEGTEIPAAVAAWTRVKAGSNFDDSQNLTVAGQNGVGASLTNIFSKEFIGVTSDGKNEMTIHCTDNLSNIEWSTKKSSKHGTKVTFVPDFNHFDCDSLDDIVIDIIKDQLTTLSVIFPKITFKFNGQSVNGNFKKYAKLFNEDVITFESDNIMLGLCTSDDGFRHISYVNSIHTKTGGTHIDYIIDELTNELIPSIKRKHKIEVNKSRIKECLTLLLFISNFPNARFDSQTKEKMSVPLGQVKSHFDIDIKKIAKAIMSNDAVLMPIIESALARKLAADKAAETKANKAASKAKVLKHIKANKAGRAEGTQLFLVEGDSATGYFLTTRDRDLQGIYPLRGKVLNTWGMANKDVLTNKELFDICAITGLTLGEKADNLNYHDIVIMTDSDMDGRGSIYPSLLSFFSNWPELFEEGRIKFCKSPIIIAEKGKDEKWYYTLEDYEKDQDNLKGYRIRYIKGLGGLTEENYEKVIRNPVFEVVSLPEDWKNKFEMLFGSDAEPRKVWMSA